MKHIWQSGNRNWLIFGLLSILIIGGGRAFMRQPAIAASVIGAGDIPANNPYLLGCLPRPLVLPEGKIVSTEEMSILADIAARSVVALNGIHPMSLDPDKMAIRNAVYAAQADALYDFVQAHPDSGITPSIAEQLAGYYKREGRYSIALPLWAFVWEDTKNEQDPQTRWIADSALVEYLHLLASLGRVEQLTQLFEETRQRIFSSTHSVLYLRYLEAWQHMQINPGKSFRCGTLALLNAAKALHDTNEFGAVLAKIKSPATGFSIKALFALSEELKLGFVPVKWGDNKIISFPSVVHWKENHYAAILSKVGDRYLVVDPTFGDEVLLTEDAIFMEASGTFLVPQQEAAKGWISITPEEQAQTFGKGYANFLGDGDDAPTCDGGSSSGGNQCGTCAGLTSAQGMPVWWVSEPWINLWLKDEPLSYQPAIGGEIKVSLLYKQRKVDGIGEGDGYASTLGGGWVFPWSGGMEASWLLSYGTANGYVKLYSSDGTYKKFKFNGQEISPPDFYDFSTVEIVRNGSNVVIGLIRHLKDGSKETYDYYPGRYTFYLTSKSDPHNYTIQVEYANTAASGTDAIVKRVIDPDGNALVFTYDQSGGNTNRVSKITDATGRSAQFIYQDTSGVGYYDLHQIIDAAGITNSINYDSYHQATSLLTPYGTTSFDSFTDRNNVAHHEVRYLTVTQPNGSKLRWLFDSSSYGTSYDPFPNGYTVPAVTSNTFDQGVYDRNSYHWDARNFDNLSQATKDDPTAFTAAELLAARFRHWLGTSSDGAIGAIDTLALERPASADGTTEPQSTWYDYPSKPDTGSHGSQNLPSTTARVMPDGTTWYLQETRNTLGRVTQSVEHWFVGATDYTRTNTYTYDSNGIDLLTHTDPNGAVVEGYAYDSSHPGLPVRITNAVSEVTYLAYDAYHRLLSRQTPADLRTTNTYDGTTKYLSKTVDYFGTTPFRTNLYTYQTNYLVSHTDPLGLTRTFEYDNLRRLLKVNYPDSTYEQTGYAISSAYPSSTGGLLLLDRTSQRDRLGKMTYFQWTPNRQIFAVTDPLSVVTAYGYCICGALDYVTNAYGTALAEVTH